MADGPFGSTARPIAEVHDMMSTECGGEGSTAGLQRAGADALPRAGRAPARLTSLSLAVVALGFWAGAAGCGGGGGGQAGIDAGLPADGGPTDDGGVADDAAPPQQDAPTADMPVVAAQNVLSLASCGVTPALLSDIPAGTYSIRLDASTLSKGYDNATPPNVSVDNYVVVHLPLAANDAQQDHRFFMLNGIDDSYTFTLSAPGTIEVMFIDSDDSYNSGQATVSLSPGGYSTTVDAVANVLKWQTGCNSAPATTPINSGSHDSKLVASTLSSGPSMSDNFVVLRLPSEVQQDDYRYVILNGVGASHAFDSVNGGSVRAWFITAGAGASGEATVRTTGP